MGFDRLPVPGQATDYGRISGPFIRTWFEIEESHPRALKFADREDLQPAEQHIGDEWFARAFNLQCDLYEL